MSGTYWPGFAASIPGLGPSVPFEVQSQEGSFSFALDAQGKVTQGCGLGALRAFEGLAGDHPIAVVFEGSVNCATGAISAAVTGYYQVFGASSYLVVGTLTGTAAEEGEAFSGTWNLEDAESAAERPPGGEGPFEVTLQAKPAPFPKACADLLAAPAKP